MCPRSCLDIDLVSILLNQSRQLPHPVPSIGLKIKLPCLQQHILQVSIYSLHPIHNPPPNFLGFLHFVLFILNSLPISKILNQLPIGPASKPNNLLLILLNQILIALIHNPQLRDDTRKLMKALGINDIEAGN